MTKNNDKDVGKSTNITVGERFLITSGVWDGCEGRLIRRDDACKWTVEIKICQQYVTASIDPTKFSMTPLDD